MKKILAILMMIWAGAMICAMGAPVDRQEAKKQALKVASQLKQNKQVTVTELKVAGLDNLYLYNIDQGGFVIISGDDRTRVVLGYDRNGHLNADNLPDNLLYWLKEYQHQISQLGNITLQELYAAYSPNSDKPTYPDSVAPLLTTAWNQYRYGYNSMVPYDSTYASDSNMAFLENHPTVGCGAVAMAQIMRYWQFPSHGYGSHSYSHDYPCWHYGTLSADFANTTYDYSLMPDRLDSSSTAAQVMAVATLLSHCGIAANMSYNSSCSGSSGSTINDNLAGLQRFFHYNSSSQVTMKYYYTENQWANMLKNDLANNRPIYYCGQSEDNEDEGTVRGGHAFVCDGYDSSNYFHFNWGWNGSCNGFYSLSVLRPLTRYDFTGLQYCILGLEPCHSPMPIMVMGSDLSLSRTIIPLNGTISGRYSITNIGDSVLNCFVGVNIYGSVNQEYYGCVDGRRIIVEPGDTVVCDFSYALQLPEGQYMALMQYSPDTFYAGIEVDQTLYMSDLDYQNLAEFTVTGTSATDLSNLVIFVRFADDPEIGTSFDTIDTMFNGTSNSVARYFSEMSYGKIHFNTIYTNGVNSSNIEAYIDPLPRRVYQPSGDGNPDGYQGEMPQIGISMLEAQLIERICRFVDSARMVRAEVTLDGDGDGDIDNISFILQGSPDNWGNLLWPHMEYFPHDSIGYLLTINGKRVNSYNFEFEGSPTYFTRKTFCHEMGHSIGLPDLYHYNHYTHIVPVCYDIMCNSINQPSAIYKHKVLGLTDAPTQIITNGTYTINSLGSSASNNLYYIKSSIDTNQWFTIEYRSTDDFFENGLPSSGLIMGRWVDTLPLDQYFIGNAFFDYHSRPNTYWVFRPGSNSDTINGDHRHAVFHSGGSNAFGPNTDPHPYLTDGTPELSFEIYDIRENGSTCSFSVRFLGQEGIDSRHIDGPLSLRPNPASSRISIQGLAAETPVKIYDARGSLVLSTRYSGTEIDVSNLAAGLYFVATPLGASKLIKN